MNDCTSCGLGLHPSIEVERVEADAFSFTWSSRGFIILSGGKQVCHLSSGSVLIVVRRSDLCEALDRMGPTGLALFLPHDVVVMGYPGLACAMKAALRTLDERSGGSS